MKTNVNAAISHRLKQFKAIKKSDKSHNHSIDRSFVEAQSVENIE